MSFTLPRLYAILDKATCDARGLDLFRVAAAWVDAGITLVQYRDKVSTPDEIVANARRLRTLLGSALLVMNDSASRAREAGCTGVHLGQGDGSVEEALQLVPVVGVSTHTEEEARSAQLSACAYVAVGPVFATSTKSDASPVVGLQGVRAVRTVVRKPLVAIGGITIGNAAEVLDAGADSVAVISALLPPVCDAESLRKHAKRFLAELG